MTMLEPLPTEINLSQYTSNVDATGVYEFVSALPVDLTLQKNTGNNDV